MKLMASGEPTLNHASTMKTLGALHPELCEGGFFGSVFLSRRAFLQHKYPQFKVNPTA